MLSKQGNTLYQALHFKLIKNFLPVLKKKKRIFSCYSHYRQKILIKNFTNFGSRLLHHTTRIEIIILLKFTFFQVYISPLHISELIFFFFFFFFQKVRIKYLFTPARVSFLFVIIISFPPRDPKKSSQIYTCFPRIILITTAPRHDDVTVKHWRYTDQATSSPPRLYNHL